MRPSLLDPLFAQLTTLPGIGGKLSARLEKAFGPRVLDLLWLFPNGYVDRRYAPALGEVESGRIATLTVTVLKHLPPASNRQPYRVLCGDDSEELTVVFFHARAAQLKSLLPVGDQRIISGRIEVYGDRLQITHPDHIVPIARRQEIPPLEPVRPLTEGVSAKVMNKSVRSLLDRLPPMPEWIPQPCRDQYRWPRWNDAVRQVHHPTEPTDFDRGSPALQRLIFDELLANQLALQLIRQKLKGRGGRSQPGDGTLCGRLLNNLPFAMTNDQQAAMAEIKKDMASHQRMIRLLQGDVGSGKTLVAVMAMLAAVESGGQAALMAPTEVLARQHHQTLRAWLDPLGQRVELLTGGESGAMRVERLEAIANGSATLIVGTHALFQETVVYRDLALVVIDEQHRFGVRQRSALMAKGRDTDLLSMSATPIPRTLTLTTHGDMDVSLLREKPAGRKPVDTRAMPLDRMDQVVDGIERAVAGGERVFWICPAIDDDQSSARSSALVRHRELASRFGKDKVAVIHGRMAAEDRERLLLGLADGQIHILVSTTVIEVGVDVPQATVMVIEQADRFGLSQLHQLRGRIGRGGRHGYCLLLYGTPLSEDGRARLEILRQSDDGFEIAERDLALRGAGQLLGHRQSGMSAFRIADATMDADLLELARQTARTIIEENPRLEGDEGASLRLLLHLFEKEAALVRL